MPVEEAVEVAKEESKIKVMPHFCPICGVETIRADAIEDGKSGDRSLWFECQCGVWFQSEPPTGERVYDDKYIAALAEGKSSKDRYEYMLRLYAPLIEELTFGRMMLDVGFCVPYILAEMRRRGWLTWGIDVNPALTGKGNIYRGDFLNYDFSISNESVKEATGKEKVDREFDLIWMGHVLEHFENPLAAIQKAHGLLETKGVLFISTPDVEFIYKNTVAGWPHFKKREHYIMWSERALVRELERAGFDIIMKRRNFSSRFMSWFDLHIIAQKHWI